MRKTPSSALRRAAQESEPRWQARWQARWLARPLESVQVKCRDSKAGAKSANHFIIGAGAARARSRASHSTQAARLGSARLCLTWPRLRSTRRDLATQWPCSSEPSRANKSRPSARAMRKCLIAIRPLPLLSCRSRSIAGRAGFERTRADQWPVSCWPATDQRRAPLADDTNRQAANEMGASKRERAARCATRRPPRSLDWPLD